MTLLDVSLPTPVFAQVQNLNLAWDPSDSPDIEHHNVYVGTASGAHDVAVTAVPASQTTYPFPATAGVLYYFAVSAVTTDGVESPRSQEISWSVPLIFSLPARTSVVDRAITAVHVSAVDPDGGVLRFSHTGLPLGLVLDSVTGTIVGIPRSTGTFDVTIFVSDGVVTSSQTFAWTIRSPGSADTTAPNLSITSHRSGQSVTSSTITVSGTASDSGLGDSGITRVTVNGLTATGGSASGSGTAHWSRSISLSGSTNTVLVEALDGGGNYSAELITLTRETNPQWQPITAGPLAITSLTTNLAGPQAPGSVISFTADASGGTAPYQYKWWVLSGGVWTMAREWGSSATLNWQPTTAGSYVVAVWGRNAGVTADASQALAQVPYDISNSIGGSYAQSASPANFAQLTLSSLTSNLASPQVPGTTVTFSAAASGGTAPYQYKWWLSDGTAWSVVRDWNTSPSMTWRPTTAGPYTVAVWARNAGVTVDANQALAYVTYDISSSSAPVSTPAPSPTQLTLSSLTSDLASPQVPGTTVTFSADASGGAAP